MSMPADALKIPNVFQLYNVTYGSKLEFDG